MRPKLWSSGEVGVCGFAEGKAWQVDPAAVSAAIAQQSCTLSHTAVATVSDHHQLILVALCNLTGAPAPRLSLAYLLCFIVLLCSSHPQKVAICKLK